MSAYITSSSPACISFLLFFLSRGSNACRACARRKLAPHLVRSSAMWNLSVSFKCNAENARAVRAPARFGRYTSWKIAREMIHYLLARFASPIARSIV